MQLELTKSLANNTDLTDTCSSKIYYYRYNVHSLLFRFKHLAVVPEGGKQTGQLSGLRSRRIHVPGWHHFTYYQGEEPRTRGNVDHLLTELDLYNLEDSMARSDSTHNHLEPIKKNDRGRDWGEEVVRLGLREGVVEELGGPDSFFFGAGRGRHFYCSSRCKNYRQTPSFFHSGKCIFDVGVNLTDATSSRSCTLSYLAPFYDT